ncbi:hypothetical protein PSECIP111951_01076 [Pseudoalteromonas holothuriae]|uniref:MalT-like TPR region domain-containing protein n=1 Tax=Pseudoalteromonas holothuriae TaxID=2963714 RepID=A0ABM9GGD4_9GAMM|nr:hypothetical protein PSECIP111951_01076 [Pseudoalteromonas sp. CIP111951]
MLRFLLITFLLLMCLSSVQAKVCQKSENNITGDILTCKRVIQTLPKHSDDAFEATLELVILYRQAGDIKLADQALDALLKQDLSTLNKYKTTRQKGINAYHQREYIQSLSYFHDAQLLALKLADTSLIGKSANDLANGYQALGDLDTALMLLLESYQIAKQLNDIHRQAITLNNLGNVSRDIDQLDDAILSFRQAHLLHQQTGNISKANHTIISLAEVFFKKRQFDKAVSLIHDTLEPLKQSGSHAQVSRAYLLLAEIAIAQNNIQQAAQWLTAQSHTRQLIQTNHVDQRALLVGAKLKQLEGDHNTAQSLLKQGLNAHSQQNSQLTELFYIALIQSQLKANQFQDATATLQNYNSMLKNSRLQNESLYQFRLQRANILMSPKQESNIGLYVTVFSTIAFLLGVLISGIYFKKRRQRLSEANDSNTQLNQPNVRLLMVEVMTLALTIWEQTSGKTRIELAEQSKTWKVNIDDGRLRVRTFERYLNIKTLPKKPRWRNIVATANYVLQHCLVEHPLREKLQQKVHQLESVVLNIG